MKLRIKIQNEARQLLSQMAMEAGVSMEDMAEIAVYNLCGCYLRERSQGRDMAASDVVSSAPHDGSLLGGLTVDVVGG